MVELTEQKQQARVMWAMGDYPGIVEKIASAGAKAVEAAGVTEGDEVLDVACGSGNATIPAALTGAKVTGLDITPELLESGRENAAQAGVEIDWVEGDAEQLPYDEGSFDAVISVFGCMFAPDHQATAAELARVLRPGGRVAVCAWTPDGNVGQFFMAVAKHMPPPPEGFQPPILWGTEDHAHELFDASGVEVEFEQGAVEFVADSAAEFLAEYERKLPPIVAAKAMLEPEGKWQALRDEIEALYETHNVADGGGYRAPGEYLVIRGKKS
ncbi:MAG TPA: class I SAM-dependent methyltransferase [Solirubrobacterales bacterium]